MSLIVDDRVGSADLAEPLRRTGLPVKLARLEFGDVAFVGRGADRTTLDIGVELKTLGDLVGSLRSGRLAGHQLPGLRQTYDYAWVLVEGLWRHGAGGEIVWSRGGRRGWSPLPGGMTASELEKQLLTLELCGGLHVRHTTTRRDTLRVIGALYRWWVDTPLDHHTSHLALHEPPSLVPLSEFRQAVCRWPGIGRKTSLAVEQHFQGSIRAAACADIEEWAAITTLDERGHARRLGPKDAQKIVNFCNRRTS